MSGCVRVTNLELHEESWHILEKQLAFKYQFTTNKRCVATRSSCLLLILQTSR